MRFTPVLLASVLVAVGALGAQSVPKGVAFNASADHYSAVVNGYRVYVVQGDATVRSRDVGKPQPDGTGSIIYMDAELFAGLGAGNYDLFATAYGPGGESSSDRVPFNISTTSSGFPAPPSGPRPIYDDGPARSEVLVQTEDFMDGGQSMSYYDLTPGNDGGAFRNTDVDVESTSDAGGGYDIGWTGAGEWLAYRVNVPVAGTYALEVRVAALGSGGIFHIEVDGIDRTGPMYVPDTGGWQVWTTIRRDGVALAAGAQTWRLVIDTQDPDTGAAGNYNWIRAVPQ